MRELGRRGGQARVRGVDDAVAASDLGRARLVELAQSDDPKVAISAARALFSYGSTRPSADEDETLASEDALLARLAAPETWTPRLRDAINRASVTDPEVKRKIAEFTDRVAHAATLNRLEEFGLVRVLSGSEAEKLRDEGREARREQEEARRDGVA